LERAYQTKWGRGEVLPFTLVLTGRPGNVAASNCKIKRAKKKKTALIERKNEREWSMWKKRSNVKGSGAEDTAHEDQTIRMG